LPNNDALIYRDFIVGNREAAGGSAGSNRTGGRGVIADYGIAEGGIINIYKRSGGIQRHIAINLDVTHAGTAGPPEHYVPGGASVLERKGIIKNLEIATAGNLNTPAGQAIVEFVIANRVTTPTIVNSVVISIGVLAAG
jgi:hypothetical protein